jgi:UDP-2,3-diacylglucosamine pyrophosphatase LpxH
MIDKSKAWDIKQHSPHAYTLCLKPMKGGERQRILFIADEHWDNAHCNRTLLKSHLKQAMEQGAPVIRVGDTFCAMQGKWDKRSDQNQMRSEHRGGNYLDKLVDTSVAWYAPYASCIALSLRGNHETSIIKHHETDLMDRWHTLTKHVAKGYTGLVAPYWAFLAVRIPTPQGPDVRVAYLHHGYGGGGEVTRGMIDNNRTRSQVFADWFISGHIHRRNQDENVVLTYHPQSHTIAERRQLFLRCASYKTEWESGWQAQRGQAARPLGGWWVEIESRWLKKHCELFVTPIPA